MNPALYVAFWLTALVVAGYAFSRLLSRLERLIHHAQQTRNLGIETNRLLSRLVEIETTKQTTRQSGRELLRERLAERVALAVKDRQAKQG
jgi:hypothetical protein